MPQWLPHRIPKTRPRGSGKYLRNVGIGVGVVGTLGALYVAPDLAKYSVLPLLSNGGPRPPSGPTPPTGTSEPLPGDVLEFVAVLVCLGIAYALWPREHKVI